MNCPRCGREMTKGVVQSARWIFFTTKAHKFFFRPNTEHGEDILLSSHNWTRPTCPAYHCAACRQVVMDYAENAE